MNDLIRRILVYAAIVCLVITGATPVQASPPNEYTYALSMNLLALADQTVCLNEQFDIAGGFVVRQTSGDLASIVPFHNAVIKLSAKLGKLEKSKFIISTVWPHQAEGFGTKYTATKIGSEVVTVTVTVPKVGTQTRTRTFQVRRCKYDMHGSVDMTKVGGAALVIPDWEPVGTYDVSGTFQVGEDDTIHGEATASLFVDVHFTGQSADGITCHHTTPWEGFTTVEIEADPNAWAHENELDLKLTMQPMQINTTRVECQGPDDAYGYGDSPAITISLFDLNFDGLPADGGSTSLNFQFPAGQGEFEMDLNVSPQEEES